MPKYKIEIDSETVLNGHDLFDLEDAVRDFFDLLHDSPKVEASYE